MDVKKSQLSDNFTSSNPIEQPRIMPLNTRTSSNRLYSGYNASSVKLTDNSTLEVVSMLNQLILSGNDSSRLFYDIHNKICPKFNLSFIALGICNLNSNYINLKLIDKLVLHIIPRLC